MSARWGVTTKNDVAALSLSAMSDAAASPSDEAVVVVVSGVVAAPTTAVCTSTGATVVEVIPLRTDNNVWGAAWVLTNVQPSTDITVTLNTGKNMTIAVEAYEGSGVGNLGALFDRLDGSNLSTLPGFTSQDPDSTVVGLWIHRDTATNGTPAGSTVLTVASGTVRQQLDGSATATGATGHAAITDRVTTGTTIDSIAGTYTDGALAISRGSTNAMGRQVEILPPDDTPVTTGQILTGGASNAGSGFLRGWFATIPGADVRMAVSQASDLSGAVYSTLETVPASGWVTPRVDGLTPNTAYHMGLEINGILQDDGRKQARTFPVPGSAASFKIIAGSCQQTGSNHASLARAATEGALAFLHGGDWHYGDAVTDTEWHTDFMASAVTANMQALLASTTTLYSPDNHDFAGNDGHAGSPAAAFVPPALRQMTGEFTDPVGWWRTWVIGRVRFIRTDMYSQRSDPNAVDGPSKHLLGPTQEAWFYDVLENAEEPVIVWFSGWPNHNMANGRWGSYTTAVNGMEAWLDARPEVKERIVCLGADSHDVRADSGTRPAIWQAFAGLPSLNASPFDSLGNVGETQSWDIGYLDIADGRGAYSRLTFTDDGTSINLLWEAVHDDGVVLLDWETTFVDNAPPVADAGFNQTVYVNTPMTLDGSFSSDPDGTIASYAWSQTSGPAVTLSGTGATRTFTPSVVGTYVFSLSVTDNDGATSVVPDTVTITAVAGPPVVEPPGRSTTPFGLVEFAVKEIIEGGYEPALGKTGGDVSYEAGQDLYVLINLVSGNTDEVDGEWALDIDVFGDSYRSAMEHALSIEALLVGPRHNSSIMRIDNCYQNEAPSERPWPDEGAYRIGATYVFTARRSG